LNKTKQSIKTAIVELRGLISVKFDETTILFVFLNKVNPELTSTWQHIVSDSETIKNNIIKNLENLNKELPVFPFKTSTQEFDGIAIYIKGEIDALFAKKPDQEIGTLTFQMNYLIDKSLLLKLLPQISSYISSYKWALAAENSQSTLRTNSLTTFQGSLFNQHITNKYKEIFNAECQFLKAPPVVEIVQQNNRLKTFRKLSVAHKIASQILSEGEQRAISLADFLTEIQLNPNNRGVIFDDPVTSLDHQRRALIAQRLVQISAFKQVIIFTHDISFFAKLTHYAENTSNISVTKTTMRRIGDTIGIVKPELPWVAQKVKDRIGYLRNALVRLKKLEKEGSEEEYNMQVKGWYGLLREAWERCVEERLFKGTIERFSGEVHTKPLKNIEITPELVSMIDEGMTQSSNWVHDQAMGLNPPIPDSSKAEEDLDLLFEFSEKCKA
ncbi:MAG: AAA family ATPase, partial [Lutibacter sp.]